MNDKKKQTSDSSQSEADEKEKKKASASRHRTVIVMVCAIAVVALVVAAAALIPGTAGSDTTSTAKSETSIEATKASEDSETDKAGEETCDHDWTVTYKTVHHDAVTHTETVEPVYANETTYHTVCNDCKQVIDGKADEHIEETGHSGYTTNVPITDEVLVSKGYSHEVTDPPAYDETVADEMVCTKCGASRPVDDAVTSNQAN